MSCVPWLIQLNAVISSDQVDEAAQHDRAAQDLARASSSSA